MLVAAVTRHTSRICVNLKSMCRDEFMWECGRLCATFDIKRTGCTEDFWIERVCECNNWREIKHVIPPTIIRYPVSEVDEHGRGCCLLDKKFLDMPTGRYDVAVSVQGEHVADFQLDLQDRVSVDSIHMG